MENIKSIINHTVSNPQYNLGKLKTQNKLSEFKSKLPVKFRDWVSFIYIKNNKIFFVLKHPSYKQEFKYILNEVKFLLNLHKITINGKDITLSDINYFVTNKIERVKKSSRNKKISKDKELSFGIFENKAKNEDIYNMIEDIRTSIIKNR
jgi:hypothetical protein